MTSTTTLQSPSATATTAATTDTRGTARRVLPVVAGGALIAGAAMFFAGLATSPPSDGDAKVEYLASLARDPFLTQLSALLLHYGNLFMGAGLLAVPLLVRGRKGGILSLVGALFGALGLLQISGSLLSDWFHMELGRNLPLEQAATISDKVLAHPAEQLAFNPGPLVSLALLVTFIGLARAGVVGWWTVPAIVVGYAGMLLLPYSTPILPALGALPMLAVLALAGWRTIARARVRTTA